MSAFPVTRRKADGLLSTRPIRSEGEERVANSRGRRVPRGVKRKMSGYKLRPRAPQPATRVDFTAAVRIVK